MAKMIEYNFVLKRPSTGTVVRYKETMPENYLRFYVDIMGQSYPGWEISYSYLWKTGKES